MSASLVGSEMCIRDSPKESQPAAPPAKVVQRGPKESQPAAPPATVVPVSYTHLTLPTICSV
eukprot:13328205-Alexandrium_andersonii.AAC.1